MKNKIGEIIVQIIPVMIGVYLGFVVSNWAEHRKVKHESTILVESIKSEMKNNKARLLEVVSYHAMLRDSARAYSNNEDLPAGDVQFKGIKMQNLSNSAYLTGNQTGVINELSIDKIQALNQLYTFQKGYDDLGKMMLSAMVNTDFFEDEKSIRKMIRFLSLSMTDAVVQENELILGYDKVSELLDK